MTGAPGDAVAAPQRVPEPVVAGLDPPDWRRGAARNAAANGVSRLVAVGTSFVLTPAILHAVGTEEFGLWVLVGSIVAYGSLLNLGIGGAITKYVAEHRARDETAAARATIGTAARLYVAMGVVVGLAGLPLAAILPGLIGAGEALTGLVRGTTLLMAVGVGATIAFSAAPAVLRGLQRYDLAGGITIVTSLLWALGTVVALAAGWGIPGVVGLGIPLPVVAHLLATLAIRRVAPELAATSSLPWAMPGDPAPAGERRRLAARLLGFSWPLLVIDVAGMLQSKTDEIVVGIVLTLGAVTPYALGRRLSAIPRMLAEQFAVLILPLASELDARQDRQRLQALYLGGVRVSLAVAMPLTGCLVLLAVPLLQAWVGPGFEEGAPIVVILAVATAIDLSLWPAGFVLQGMNRHRWLAPASLGSGLANLILSLALAPSLGIVGVALGTLIPTTVEAVVLLTPFTLRTLRIGAARFLLQALAPVLLPLVPMVAVLIALMQIVPPSSIPAIVVLLAVAHVVYGVAYLAMGPAAPERRLLRDLLVEVPRIGSLAGRQAEGAWKGKGPR